MANKAKLITDFIYDLILETDDDKFEDGSKAVLLSKQLGRNTLTVQFDDETLVKISVEEVNNG